MKVDLASETGNAFELISIAVAAAHQMDMAEAQVFDLVKRMTARDYKHLLSVMEETFPWCFEFVNDPRGVK